MAVICNFWHPGTLTLKAERQSTRIWKITNEVLQLYPYGNSGRQRVRNRSTKIDVNYLLVSWNDDVRGKRLLELVDHITVEAN